MIDTPATIMRIEDAEDFVRKATAEEEDGWIYTVEPIPQNPGKAKVRVTEADGTFIHYL